MVCPETLRVAFAEETEPMTEESCSACEKPNGPFWGDMVQAHHAVLCRSCNNALGFWEKFQSRIAVYLTVRPTTSATSGR
jgi:hypothetical protein